MTLTSTDYVALHRERKRLDSFNLDQLRARRVTLLAEFSTACTSNDEKQLAVLYLRLRAVTRLISEHITKTEDASHFNPHPTEAEMMQTHSA